MGLFCAATGQLLGGAGINQLATHHRYGNIGYYPSKAKASPGRPSPCCVTLVFSSWGYFGWKS